MLNEPQRNTNEDLSISSLYFDGTHSITVAHPRTDGTFSFGSELSFLNSRYDTYFQEGERGTRIHPIYKTTAKKPNEPDPEGIEILVTEHVNNEDDLYTLVVDLYLDPQGSNFVNRKRVFGNGEFLRFDLDGDSGPKSYTFQKMKDVCYKGDEKAVYVRMRNNPNHNHSIRTTETTLLTAEATPVYTGV